MTTRDRILQDAKSGLTTLAVVILCALAAVVGIPLAVGLLGILAAGFLVCVVAVLVVVFLVGVACLPLAVCSWLERPSPSPSDVRTSYSPNKEVANEASEPVQ